MRDRFGRDDREASEPLVPTETVVVRIEQFQCGPISRLRTYGLTKTLAGFVALMLNHFVKVSVLLIGRKCSRSSRIG
jgi:hypothetical protein